MGLSIQSNHDYSGKGTRFIKDDRLDSMYCNIPPNKKAAEEIAKKYNKTYDTIDLSSRATEQDKYEQYLRMLAFTNPIMYTTPLFIYEAAKEKANQEVSSRQSSSQDIQHDKRALSMLPGGWWFATK